MKRAILCIAAGFMALAVAPAEAALIRIDGVQINGVWSETDMSAVDGIVLGRHPGVYGADAAQRFDPVALAQADSPTPPGSAIVQASTRADGMILGNGAAAAFFYGRAAPWDPTVSGGGAVHRSPARDHVEGANKRAAGEEDNGGGMPGHLPEPASWAMMVLGFSALGFTLRRRPKASARIRFS